MLLCSKKIKKWKNIVKQYNNSSPLEFVRSFCNRDDEYKLLAYINSSGCIYGAVVYLYSYNTKKCEKCG